MDHFNIIIMFYCLSSQYNDFPIHSGFASPHFNSILITQNKLLGHQVEISWRVKKFVGVVSPNSANSSNSLWQIPQQAETFRNFPQITPLNQSTRYALNLTVLSNSLAQLKQSDVSFWSMCIYTMCAYRDFPTSNSVPHFSHLKSSQYRKFVSRVTSSCSLCSAGNDIFRLSFSALRLSLNTSTLWLLVMWLLRTVVELAS